MLEEKNIVAIYLIRITSLYWLIQPSSTQSAQVRVSLSRAYVYVYKIISGFIGSLQGSSPKKKTCLKIQCENVVFLIENFC